MQVMFLYSTWYLLEDENLQDKVSFTSLPSDESWKTAIKSKHKGLALKTNDGYM